jgi:lipopolysaccharide transport system permease protein
VTRTVPGMESSAGWVSAHQHEQGLPDVAERCRPPGNVEHVTQQVKTPLEAPPRASSLREFLEARELLVNLTRRDLSSRYRRSALGWLWSLVTPLATILVFSLVFRFFLRFPVEEGQNSGLKSFALFLVCGLVAWNFLANSVNGSMGILLGNGNLIKRVYFPRAVLVAASVASATITLGIELAVVAAVLLIAGSAFLPLLPVLLVIVALQVVFVLGISLGLSVLNVYFRDLQYIVAIVLQLGFYAAPIIYPISLVPSRALVFGVDVHVRLIYSLNPAVHLVEAYRDVLYHARLPSLNDFIAIGGSAVVALAVGVLVFRRFEPRLAEEL